MREAVDPDPLHQRQRLLQRRSLAPGAAGQQFVPAPGPAHHGFDGGMIRCHILHREVAAFLALKIRDRAGDVAAIEGVVRGLEPFQTVRSGGAILIGHEPERFRQVGLHEFLTGPRRTAARQEHRGVGGPAAVFLLLRRDRGGEQRIDREPLLREADGGGGDVGEPHRAVAAQSGDPGIRRGGDDGARDTGGDFAAMLPHEQIGGQGFRPPAKARDAFDRSVGQADDDRRDARDVHEVRLQHPERDARGDPRVDRVATGFQNGKAGRGREVMSGRDGVTGSVDGRAVAHDYVRLSPRLPMP